MAESKSIFRYIMENLVEDEEVLYKYSEKGFGRELILFALDLITKALTPS